MQELLLRLFSGLTNGSIYAIVALALVVVFRGTGTINFAQGEMALFTTYVAWWLTTLGIPVWITIVGAASLGFALGAIVERTLIRPVRAKNDMATLIVALGLFIAFNGLAGVLFGPITKQMPSLFPNDLDTYLLIGGARLYFDALGVWIVVLGLLGVTFWLFNRTKLGLQMRAVANNPESARLVGVRAGRIMMLGWGMAGAIASVAGVLIAPLSPQQLSLQTMFHVLIFASAAALLGGLDSTTGAVVGGLFIGLLQAILIGYVPAVGGELQQTAALAIIVMILLVRPTGLFGQKVTERV